VLEPCASDALFDARVDHFEPGAQDVGFGVGA
jgi:hypothetical protein